MALDETARRRDNFKADHVHFVTLADGQRWGIRRPHWRYQPVFQGKKCVRAHKRFGYRNSTDAMIEALAADGVDDATAISVVASVAAELLRESYTLSEAELDSLLCFRAGDPASLQWVRDVMDVITYQENTIRPRVPQEAESE